MVYMMIVNFLIWEPEISLFAFRLSLFAFRFSPFAFRLSRFAFRLSPFAFRLSLPRYLAIYFYTKLFKLFLLDG